MIKRALPVAILAALLGCQAAPQGFLTIAGWTPQGEPATYDANGLWELINGAADTFLAYGFETVTVQNYAAGDVIASVAVYDMGRPLNAFGIYRTEASGGEAPFAAGTEAVVAPPYQCLLLKDRYYVKMEAYEGEIDQATGEALVTAVADALPGGAGLPPEFAALPEEGMAPGSAMYTREALFGLSELNECVHATFVDENSTEFQAFAMLQTVDADGNSVWQTLESRWAKLDLEGSPVLYREVPYSGLVGVVQTEDGIIGIAGAEDEDQLLRWIDQLALG
jgi:hypothetical protein